MKALSILIPLALLTSCETAHRSISSAPRVAEPMPPVSGTDLDSANIEKIRLSENLKAYPIGRTVDPSDPNVMHESHVVYRRETRPAWNLQPNAPTVVPLGPVIAVADPAKEANPLQAELEKKVAEQNQLMRSLIEQNDALSAELGKLSKEIAELRIKGTTSAAEKM